MKVKTRADRGWPHELPRTRGHSTQAHLEHEVHARPEQKAVRVRVRLRLVARQEFAQGDHGRSNLLRDPVRQVDPQQRADVPLRGSLLAGSPGRRGRQQPSRRLQHRDQGQLQPKEAKGHLGEHDGREETPPGSGGRITVAAGQVGWNTRGGEKEIQETNKLASKGRGRGPPAGIERSGRVDRSEKRSPI